MEQDKYNAAQFAKKLNVSVRTLQRWDKEGILKAYRTPTNMRFYTDEQYEKYITNAKKEE